ncbi:MAG: Obg family GTPase CgtA [Parcubacteria group bacterium]|jgi:GTP-binding protein
MIIDDVTIDVKAGRGGDGVALFARAKFDQGPTGGNGGRGGNVLLKGVSDLGALRPFRSTKNVKAEAGKNGEQNTCTGADGAGVTISVPVGTVAHDLTHDKIYEIISVGQKVVVAKGGNGGFGNHHFRSSRNTSPKIAKAGQEGEHIRLRLELKMIADVGFVGYPNVGKSSLLNELTNAQSKVANYNFTTLEPHLGVYYDLILADIPGLIEGAAEGKGLGHKFLRHIERTCILFHFIAATSTRPVADYRAIRKELHKFNPLLSEKPEWIVVSKTDECTEKKVQSVVKKLQKVNPHVVTVSILDDTMMTDIKKILNDIKDHK